MRIEEVIKRHAGALTGVYCERYLDALRDDWRSAAHDEQARPVKSRGQVLHCNDKPANRG